MRLIFKTVALFSCIFAQLQAQEILVVKTRSIPIVEHILNGFQSVCSDKHQITIYDMQGKLHKGENILSQIQDKINEQNIKAVFTIGLPATWLIKESITDVPIVFTMVRDPDKNNFTTKNMSGISKDLPANIQLQYLKKAIPDVNRIAIIYSQKHSALKARQLFKAADTYKLKIKLYQVTSVKDVPKKLRLAITENNALIMLPDRLVINQSSLEYFISTVLENGFPALTYNRYLVNSGVLMGLSPDYFVMGQQAGHMLCSGNQPVQSIRGPEQFNFFVNSKTAKRIRMQLSSDLFDLADHVY